MAFCAIENANDDFFSRFPKLEILEFQKFHSTQFPPLDYLIKNTIRQNTKILLDLSADRDIIDFDQDFKNLRSLKIHALDVTYYKYLRNLNELNVINTQFDDLNIIVNCLIHLKDLNLGFGEGRVLKKGTFKMLTKLNSLHLAFYSLEQIEANAFEGLNELTYLYIYSTHGIKHGLQTNSFNCLQGLRNLSLWLQFTFIGSDFFDNFPNLVDLTVRHSRLHLTQRTLVSLVDLKTLNLLECRLDKLPYNALSQLTKLRALSFYNNQLTWIEKDAFANLSELLTIDFSSNRLTCLHKNVFNGLVSLESLNLRMNRLAEFNVECLRKTPNLRTISMDERVSNLDVVKFQLKNVGIQFFNTSWK